MQIKTRFDVHNLAKHKFTTTNDRNGFAVFEIMEVIAQVCYGGTQIFYLVRPICLLKQYKDKWKEDGEFVWCVQPARGKDDNSTGWQKLREDELIEAPQEFIDIVLSS